MATQTPSEIPIGVLFPQVMALSVRAPTLYSLSRSSPGRDFKIPTLGAGGWGLGLGAGAGAGAYKPSIVGVRFFCTLRLRPAVSAHTPGLAPRDR